MQELNIDQSDNISCCVLGFDTTRFNRLIADRSVENINSDMISHGMALDVSDITRYGVRC